MVLNRKIYPKNVTYSSFISFVSGVIGTLSLAWSETSAWSSLDDRDAFPFLCKENIGEIRGKGVCRLEMTMLMFQTQAKESMTITLDTKDMNGE